MNNNPIHVSYNPLCFMEEEFPDNGDLSYLLIPWQRHHVLEL